MAKLILKATFFNGNTSKSLGKYAKYIATREGAEWFENKPMTIKSSGRQNELIEKLINDFPSLEYSEEYLAYKNSPTAENASEFITHTIDENLAKFMDSPTYADYIATRPRAERIGNHGLFTSGNEPIVLSDVSNELNNRQGRVWTFIVSLRREDASRLGFDNARRWKDMISSNEAKIADAMNIQPRNLKWYAAYHNEGHHPHVHIIAYSSDSKEGFVTKKGIDKIRSAFAKDIFAQDMESVYADQTDIRQQIKYETFQIIDEILEHAEKQPYENESIEQKLIELSARLKKTKGKKVYGYLDRTTKDLIDSIVDELAKNPDIAELYDLWYERKYEILGMYSSYRPSKIPLSQNNEFKSIKNSIINEALGIEPDESKRLAEPSEEQKNDDEKQEEQQESKSNNKYQSKRNQTNSNTKTAKNRVSATAVTRLFKNLCNIFRDNLGEHEKEYNPKVDKRLIREDEAKRNAEILYD